MSNYVYKNGAVTSIQDIIDHAEEAKENEGSSLTSTSLGFVVKDVWGASVQRAKRGPRKLQQYLYLNLKRHEPTRLNQNDEIHSIPLSQEVTVPEEWKVIQDKPDCVSIVCLEKWEFNNV